MVLAVALAVAIACAGETPRSPQAVDRDSAGVAIVEYEALDTAGVPVFHVGARASLSIGTAEGPAPYVFGSIANARRLADGRVVVLDWQAREIRYFDRAGRHVHSVGRRGDGPGEFQGFGMVVRTEGDSLLIADRRQPRITLLGPRGEIVRAASLPLAPSGALVQPIGRLRDGTIIGKSVRVTPRVGRQVDSATYWRLAPTGSSADSLLALFEEELYASELVVGDQRGIVRGPLPFTTAASAVAAGDGLYYADPRAYAVYKYSKDGVLLRVTRWKEPPAPVTAAQANHYRNAAIGEAGAQRAAAAERMRAMPFPVTAATFAALLVDDQSRVWVREWHPEGDPSSRWWVLGTDGHVAGAARVPSACDPLEFGDSYVLCRVGGDDEVPQVELRPLEKR